MSGRLGDSDSDGAARVARGPIGVCAESDP